MDNKPRFLLQNNIPSNNQSIQANMILQYKYSEKNKNLNESMITTSTSSLSVNNKKNLPHTNYKTPIKKNFPVPIPKPKNAKPNNQKINDKNSKNSNTVNTIIYTKGTIKKFGNMNINMNNNANVNLNMNDNNKIYGRSISQITNENENKKENIHQKRALNNINNLNCFINKSSLAKKRMNMINEAINNEYNNEISYFSNNE